MRHPFRCLWPCTRGTDLEILFQAPDEGLLVWEDGSERASITTKGPKYDLRVITDREQGASGPRLIDRLP